MKKVKVLKREKSEKIAGFHRVFWEEFSGEKVKKKTGKSCQISFYCFLSKFFLTFQNNTKIVKNCQKIHQKKVREFSWKKSGK